MTMPPPRGSGRFGALLPVDHVLRAEHICRISEVAPAQLGSRKADVIDSFEQHNMSYARHCEGVPIEAGQTVDAAERVAQQPVHDYAFIDYRRLRTAGHLS